MWFTASHIPAISIKTGPITARIEIIDNCEFVFKDNLLETF